MHGNKWWSTKVGAKLVSDLVIFSIFSSEIPLDFHELNASSVTKIFNAFFGWYKY